MNIMIVDQLAIRNMLKQCWSRQSSSLWTEDNPACGQCGVTSLVIQDRFGGDILKTHLANGQMHFYNRIENERIDFTDEQFTEPLLYLDQLATRAEAFADTNEAQYRYLSNAFRSIVK
jgi:hypothetical protein